MKYKTDKKILKTVYQLLKKIIIKEVVCKRNTLLVENYDLTIISSKLEVLK